MSPPSILESFRRALEKRGEGSLQGQSTRTSCAIVAQEPLKSEEDRKEVTCAHMHLQMLEKQQQWKPLRMLG